MLKGGENDIKEEEEEEEVISHTNLLVISHTPERRFIPELIFISRNVT
jgi:hypothetical protein